MAEALSAVGAVASFIQVVDATLRTSLYLYNFFSSLNNADSERRRHVIVLEETYDTILLVRAATNDAALKENELVLLSKQLRSITGELSMLEKLIQGKEPAKLGTKMMWVLKKSEMHQTLQNLENHKNNLIAKLQALNILTELDSLKQLVEQQNKDVTILKADLQAGLSGLQTRIDSNFQNLDDGGNLNVSASENCLKRVFKRILDEHVFHRVRERLATESSLNNAATISQMQSVVGHATRQILTEINENANEDMLLLQRGNRTNQESENSAPSPSNRFHRPDSFLSIYGQTKTGSLMKRNSTKDYDYAAATYRSLTRSEWAYEISIPPVGKFRVEHRTFAGPQTHFWTLNFVFWPTCHSIFTRCISLKYSSRRDTQGYIAIFPSLMIRPMISEGDAIGKSIVEDDVDGVVARYQAHKNSLFDQYPNGMSLLQSKKLALLAGKYKVARFLLSQGADPTQTQAYGWNGIQSLTYMAIVNAISLLKPTRGEYLLLFFDLFQSMIAAGCSLQGLKVDFMIAGAFLRLPFNSDGDVDSSEPEYTGCATELGFFEMQKHRAAESYLANIRPLAQFLSLQGCKLIRDRALSTALSSPKRMTLPVLQELGLKGNYKDQSSTSMKSVLYLALDALHKSLVSPGILLRNLIRLISGGADIYDIEWACDDKTRMFQQEGLISPTLVANATGLLVEWVFVLQETGHDPVDVILEDRRRRKEF
ncbi:hypothetical protein FGADI_9262 [Fusarium gaditjirri]|uniref:Fungal N-terminal domain-containing protein n=1 Tax=Fusarium gaditjirri TaxID=282569 RepID=A0A8H4WST5_9HYPO|nr:hypothetical protein FGADI_9262 [Fusarium gaditjirri]